MFECPDAILTCSVLKCYEKNFLVFGGHDKTLYLMNEGMNIVDDRAFDGWVRCSFPIDLDGDGCDEILVGAGDGNFMVLKLNVEKEKLVGLMRYRSKKRINCCTAGDFTQDGNIELIIGGEDKTVKIFDSLQAKEPKFIFYYDSWVTVCALGFLKLPDEDIPILGLVVGTKNGLIQLIRFKDELPEILWQQDFKIQINDIKIGDITNDGFNEIIFSADDSTIKILDATGQFIKEITVEEGRPLSLLIEDIDGDRATELVAGCADGSLKVYHNLSLDSTDIEVKWKTKVATSIKHICFQLDRSQNKKNIVFGGYDRAIRIVTDFEWGDKEPLEIPQQIEVTKIQPPDELLLIEKLAKIEEVPTNIREHIFQILLEKGYLKEIETELKNLGYTEDEILDELTLLKTQKAITYEKVIYPVWSIPGEEKEEVKEEIIEVEPLLEEPKVIVKPMLVEETPITDIEKLSTLISSEEEKEEKGEAETIVTEPKVVVEAVVVEEPIKKDQEKLSEILPSKEGSLREVIIDYLKQRGHIATKAEFVVDIKAKGFEVKDVEKEINALKVEGIIQYSRVTPKGWSLKK